MVVDEETEVYKPTSLCQSLNIFLEMNRQQACKLGDAERI